ncbi:MAG: hypothetical protein Fur0024_3190 [Patescibacteria group bacterium]
METGINIGLIVTSIIIIFLLLIQNKSGGLSSTFGGSGGFYGTRRGIERSVFMLTWIMVFVFAVLIFVRFF